MEFGLFESESYYSLLITKVQIIRMTIDFIFDFNMLRLIRSNTLIPFYQV